MGLMVFEGAVYTLGTGKGRRILKVVDVSVIGTHVDPKLIMQTPV